MKAIKFLVAALALFSLCRASYAFDLGNEPLDTAVLTGFYSHHFTNNEKKWAAPRSGFREQNYGVGLRFGGGFAVGYYRNSLDNDSIFAAYEWQWKLFGSDYFRVGLIAGGVSGYKEPVAPLVVPELIVKLDHWELAGLLVPSLPKKTPFVAAAQLRYNF
jgi:hypothetical protein